MCVVMWQFIFYSICCLANYVKVASQELASSSLRRLIFSFQLYIVIYSSQKTFVYHLVSLSLVYIVFLFSYDMISFCIKYMLFYVFVCSLGGSNQIWL